jgi:2-oxoglutarate ferredoxin oxidoreductase subunit gamma
MEDRIEIRIAGSAGQGVITATYIIAKAATLEGKYAVQSTEFGAAVRTGVSRGDVIISGKEIDYPQCEALDYLVILSREAYWEEKTILDNPLYTVDLREYAHMVKECSLMLKENGLTILDSDLEVELDTKKCRVLRFPVARRVIDELGSRQAITVAFIGIIAEMGKFLRRDSIERALLDTIPSKFKETGLKALNIGYSIAEETSTSI